MTDYSLLLQNAPLGWKDFQLSDICYRVQGNYQPNPNGTRLYLGLEHLAQGLPMLVGSGIEADVKSSKNSFLPNDVLFGKLRPYLRKCVMAKEEGVCSTDILVFRVNEAVLPQYLCFMMHTDQFIGHAKATTSGVQHPRTSWNALREFRITLPSFDEQYSIVRVLNTVQVSFEQQLRYIAVLRELKSALMHKLFTEGLRGEKQKQTEIGLVPESWNVVELGEIAEIIMGQSPPGESYNTEGIGVPLINGPVEFGSGSLALTLETKFTTNPTKLCQKDDLILCVRGSTTGRTNIAKDKACIGRGVAAVRARGNQDFLNQFIVSIRERIYKMGTGTTFPNISGNQIKEILLPCPPIPEQIEIAHILTTIDKRLELSQEKQVDLEELFRILLHKLMTSQIRVNDLELTSFS
jgi:type I restriction enzyme, S subunit